MAVGPVAAHALKTLQVVCWAVGLPVLPRCASELKTRSVKFKMHAALHSRIRGLVWTCWAQSEPLSDLLVWDVKARSKVFYNSHILSNPLFTRTMQRLPASARTVDATAAS